ncbi:MAG: hypothetical protein U9Q03_00415 [Patescibacteria group bacterium]|nr:hypothetical protein [Patescibacteria group bacterium]
MSSSDIHDPILEFLDENADSLRQLVMEKIAEGAQPEDLTLLLFDMTDEFTVDIVRNQMPELAAQCAAVAKSVKSISTSCSTSDAIMLMDGTAHGDHLKQKPTEGAVFILIFAHGGISLLNFWLVQLDQPSN